MLLQPDYTTGTVSISDGSAALTGSGTAWLSAGFQPGDLFMKNNRSAVILSINSNTSITLAENWDGGNLAGAYYRIRYQPDLSRVSAQARQLIDMLASGNLPSLGELNGVGGDKGIHLTGAGTAATHALTAFMRGILSATDGPTAYGGLGQIPNAQVRNDLPADKAFRRGNVVGTVAQSGGVPTGALVEVGSNANGLWLRFAGGFQLSLSQATGIMLNNGSGTYTAPYYSDAFTLTHPVAFIAAPVCLGGMAEAGADDIATPQRPCIFTHFSISATTVGACRIYNPAGGRPTVNGVKVSALSIGRWHA